MPQFFVFLISVSTTICSVRFKNNMIIYNQKSVPIRWVLYHIRVLYLRVVALQMAYCTNLFEDSVVKI